MMAVVVVGILVVALVALVLTSRAAHKQTQVQQTAPASLTKHRVHARR